MRFLKDCQYNDDFYLLNHNIYFQDFQIRSSVRELGVVPPLLEFLKSDYAIIQELTLTTLTAVTQDSMIIFIFAIITADKLTTYVFVLCSEETRASLREHEGLEQLLNFLNNKV